jgi:autotransporter adhesin
VTGAAATPGRELSIGTAGAERRITNVAAGGADTDVANISQLRSVASVIDGTVAYDSVTRHRHARRSGRHTHHECRGRQAGCGQ